VEKVKELVKSDHFKYVVVLTREDLYFGFSLSEKAERRCISGIILSGGDTGDHIVGWLISKNLPQWVGNYSDWLMSNKDPTKKLFREEDSLRPDANCGGSNGDMSSVSDVDKFPVQKTRNRSIKAFHINSSDSEVSADEESRGG
jgi:hypothetical protein